MSEHGWDEEEEAASEEEAMHGDRKEPTPAPDSSAKPAPPPAPPGPGQVSEWRRKRLEVDAREKRAREQDSNAKMYTLKAGDRARMLLQFVASERRATITIEVETGQIRLRTNLNYFIIFTKDRKELILRTGIR